MADRKADMAGKALGGMAGKAAKKLMQERKRTSSRLADIMGSMGERQTTDSNNRKR